MEIEYVEQIGFKLDKLYRYMNCKLQKMDKKKWNTYKSKRFVMLLNVFELNDVMLLLCKELQDKNTQISYK